MYNITVRYGSDEYPRSYAPGTTIGQVINDVDLKVVAGWGDNVRALVSGVEQSPTTPISDGSTVVIETRANTKA